LGCHAARGVQEIKDTVADVTADITSRSLGDEEVKAKAENLSKSVVHQVRVLHITFRQYDARNFMISRPKTFFGVLKQPKTVQNDQIIAPI
jgi:hypothetical protein